jgi:shikimate kinase
MGNNNKIFLIGFMGSGKTTLVKKLAKKLDLPFFDLDQEIEKLVSLTINQLFEQYGEAHFRELESKTLEALVLNNDHLVLSLGGGTPCIQNNMDLVNSVGNSIYLKYNARILASRLIGTKSERPLLKNLAEHQLKEFITKKLDEREHFYKQCKIIIEKNNVNVEDVLRIIAKD